MAVLTSLSLIWLATLSTVSLTLARGIPKKITRNYMLKPRVRIPPSIFTALTDSPLLKQRVLLPSFHPPRTGSDTHEGCRNRLAHACPVR